MPAPGRSGLSLAQAIDALVESLTIRKLSPATTKADRADLAAVTSGEGRARHRCP